MGSMPDQPAGSPADQPGGPESGVLPEVAELLAGFGADSRRVRAVLCRLAADPAAADPAAGDPAAGDPAAGDPAAGDPAAGDPAAGDPAAAGHGWTISGLVAA